MAIRDRNELGVRSRRRNEFARCGPPDTVEDLSISAQCRTGQIITTYTRLAVGEIFIENVTAQPNFVAAAQSPQEAVIRKFVSERERAVLNPAFDHREPRTRAAKIGFRRRR